MSEQHHKISPAFKARLNALKPQQHIHVILMLHTIALGNSLAKRQSPNVRQALIQRIRRSAETALTDIDQILARFNGKRLAEKVDVLGTIPVEVTVEGVDALAASSHVKAILEDQPISLLIGSTPIPWSEAELSRPGTATAPQPTPARGPLAETKERGLRQNQISSPFLGG